MNSTKPAARRATPLPAKRFWRDALAGLAVYGVTAALAWATLGSRLGGVAAMVCLFAYPLAGLAMLLHPRRGFGLGLLVGSAALWVWRWSARRG